MKLEQSFEVAAPLDRVWAALIDVERVAPCLPGAAVTGRNDDGSYNGTFTVKIGPTSAAYAGKLQMENVDADAHTATMQAAGTDKRGQGGAKATIVSSVSEAGEGATKVDVATDYHITGRLARFGRGGMIEEISNRLLGQFASSLQAMVATEPAEASAGTGDGAPREEAGAPDEPEAIGTAGVLGIEAQGPETPAVGDGAPAAPAPAAPAPAAPAPAAPAPAAPAPAAPAPAAPGAPLPVPAPAGEAPPENEPVQGLSLVASALWTQAKRNPLPLLSALVGFLLALRLFRRRS